MQNLIEAGQSWIEGSVPRHVIPCSHMYGLEPIAGAGCTFDVQASMPQSLGLGRRPSSVHTRSVESWVVEEPSTVPHSSA